MDSPLKSEDHLLQLDIIFLKEVVEIQIKEFANFINIALGSSNEAENQLILAKDLGYINETNYQNLLEELILLKKKLVALWNKLKVN